MKRSSDVPARLLIATASAILAGCSQPRVVERCVDAYGNVIPDVACEPGYVGGTYYGGGGTYYGGGRVHYSSPHYIYGGSVSGGRVTGGTLTPTRNANVVNSSGTSISRAGFGSSGGGSFGRSGGFFGFGG